MTAQAAKRIWFGWSGAKAPLILKTKFKDLSCGVNMSNILKGQKHCSFCKTQSEVGKIDCRWGRIYLMSVWMSVWIWFKQSTGWSEWLGKQTFAKTTWNTCRPWSVCHWTEYCEKTLSVAVYNHYKRLKVGQSHHAPQDIWNCKKCNFYWLDQQVQVKLCWPNARGCWMFHLPWQMQRHSQKQVMWVKMLKISCRSYCRKQTTM